MDKPEVIREHNGYALCVLKTLFEKEIVPHLWRIGARAADQVRYFNYEGEADIYLADGDLDALCSWWQARRGSVNMSSLTADECAALTDVLSDLPMMAEPGSQAYEEWQKRQDTLRNLLERMGGTP